MTLGGKPRARVFSAAHLAPNILTMLALCAGLTSLRFALQTRWDMAVVAIVVAGVLDGLDGRLARLLKGASKFGAELDSLSDFVSFGVAPMVLMYLWSLRALGGVGWIVVLTFSICCALRLARFNTALDEVDKPAWQANFFTGVPAPAAAGLSLLFVFVSFEAGDTFWRAPATNAIWSLIIAFLMISRLPTFSFKKVRIRRDAVLPVLLVVAVLAAALASFPWYTLTALGVLYLVSLPFAAQSYRRFAHGEAGRLIGVDDDGEVDESDAEDSEEIENDDRPPHSGRRDRGS
jgi:CDP-diacylglycerol--serine O-phosphatidyltransferase